MSKLIALTIGGQGNGGGPGFTLNNIPKQIGAISNLSLQAIIQWALISAFTLAIILTLLFFMFGGFKWLTSQGDKKQLEEAQKTIQYALVGLILVLISVFIINFIGQVFNVSLLRVTLP